MSILTLQEAADMLKIESAADYPQLDILLPAIDDYIKTATGKDWGVDDPVDPTAKIALSCWSIGLQTPERSEALMGL